VKQRLERQCGDNLKHNLALRKERGVVAVEGHFLVCRKASLVGAGYLVLADLAAFLLGNEQ
jgi:hypothetical protein